MTKKRLRLLAVVLLGFVAILVWLTRSPNEPTYQNRPLHAWLKDLKNWDGDTNAAAYIAFREMGTNAIPSLLHVTESGGPRINQIIMKINQKQSLVRLPLGRPWDYTMAATWALYAIGTNAKPALPALANMLFHTNNLIGSSTVLAGIGGDAIPVLLTALTNQNYRIRWAAISGMGWARSDFDIVVPTLAARLRETNWVVRSAAAISLGQLRTKTEIAVPALTAALKDDSQSVRESAAWALKQIDPEGATNAGVE